MNAQARPIEPVFRPMAAEDVDRIIQIERAAYPYPWTRGNFMDCLDCGYSCWVVEVGGELVGYSILMAGAGEGHVLNCCVAPAWQGRGLGRLAMQRLIAGAPDYGVECLFLEVRPSNGTAIALYESLGFETVGLRRHYYPADQGREDALVMRLCL
jgi:ribosomal-protein-alanine N-acetyltransferase